MPTEIVAKDIADHQKLAWWRKRKQLNEQEMAKKLAVVFNQGQLIRSLRNATHIAIENLRESEELRKAVWLRERAGYRVYWEVGDWEQVERSVARLSAEHCSNIIRLYCAVVEQQKGDQAGEMMRLRRDFPQFDASGTTKAPAPKPDPAKGEKGVLWGDGKVGGGRLREPRQDDFSRAMDLRRKGYDMTDESLLGAIVKSQRGEALRLGGMAQFVMQNESTVL